MTNTKFLTETVPVEARGLRLDQAIAMMFPDYSRSLLKKWIQENRVQLDGHLVNKPREQVVPGMDIQLHPDWEALAITEAAPQAEPIPLDVRYEDEDILVLFKPVDLVVHPGAGNKEGTLLNALLYAYPELAELERAGIVHRLDKETSGLLVVARHTQAQAALQQAFKNRTVVREYEAIIQGVLTAGGVIDYPIMRHPTKRTLMTVSPEGKFARTHYRVVEKYRAHTRLRVRLETGRTHQIRVHFSSIKHPLVGDAQYGGRFRPPAQANEALLQCLRQYRHQALHACYLAFEHPVTGESVEFSAELPDDYVELIQVLRDDAEAALAEK